MVVGSGKELETPRGSFRAHQVGNGRCGGEMQANRRCVPARSTNEHIFYPLWHPPAPWAARAWHLTGLPRKGPESDTQWVCGSMAHGLLWALWACCVFQGTIGARKGRLETVFGVCPTTLLGGELWRIHQHGGMGRSRRIRRKKGELYFFFIKLLPVPGRESCRKYD